MIGSFLTVVVQNYREGIQFFATDSSVTCEYLNVFVIHVVHVHDNFLMPIKFD